MTGTRVLAFRLRRVSNNGGTNDEDENYRLHQKAICEC